MAPCPIIPACTARPRYCVAAYCMHTAIKLRDCSKATQGLVPLINVPASSASQASVLGAVWCWPFGAGMVLRSQLPTQRPIQGKQVSQCAEPDMPLAVPPPPNPLRPVALADFGPYLRRTAALHARYASLRQQAVEDPGRGLLAGEERAPRPAPGEGLTEALRTVPAAFFHEQFSLSRWASSH